MRSRVESGVPAQKLDKLRPLFSKHNGRGEMPGHSTESQLLKTAMQFFRSGHAPSSAYVAKLSTEEEMEAMDPIPEVRAPGARPTRDSCHSLIVTPRRKWMRSTTST